MILPRNPNMVFDSIHGEVALSHAKALGKSLASDTEKITHVPAFEPEIGKQDSHEAERAQALREDRLTAFAG
jgi:hypothetical protein